jgi:hypothetical protein
MGGIPLYMLAMRGIVLQLIYDEASDNVKLPARSAITFVQFLCCWALALVINSLDEVMAFVGATAQIVVGFTLPALFYYINGGGWRSNLDSGSVSFGIEDAEGGGDEHPSATSKRSIQQPGKGTLRRSAVAIAISSLVLMPIFIGAEIYKIATENH